MPVGDTRRVYDYMLGRADQARSLGVVDLTLTAGEVRDALALKGTNGIITVCQALETTRELPDRSNLRCVWRDGPKQGAGSAYRFEMLS